MLGSVTGTQETTLNDFCSWGTYNLKRKIWRGSVGGKGLNLHFKNRENQGRQRRRWKLFRQKKVRRERDFLPQEVWLVRVSPERWWIVKRGDYLMVEFWLSVATGRKGQSDTHQVAHIHSHAPLWMLKAHPDFHGLEKFSSSFSDPCHLCSHFFFLPKPWFFASGNIILLPREVLWKLHHKYTLVPDCTN